MTSPAPGARAPHLPLELAETTGIHAGIAVVQPQHMWHFLTSKAAPCADTDIDIPVADLSQDDFIQHIMAGLRKLSVKLNRPLASVGVDHLRHRHPRRSSQRPQHLGWQNVDIAPPATRALLVPVTVSS